MENVEFEALANLIERRRYIARIRFGDRSAEIGLRRATAAPLRRALSEVIDADRSYIARLVRDAIGRLIQRVRVGDIKSAGAAIGFLLRDLRIPPTDSAGRDDVDFLELRDVQAAYSVRRPGGARRRAARKTASASPALDFETSSRSATAKNKLRADPERGVTFPVWFGTDRLPAPDGNFLNARGDSVTCGKVEVFVPRTHRFGELGSSFLTRLVRGNLQSDTLVVTSVETMVESAFWSNIGGAMRAALSDDESSHAVVFIHGYNVSFDEAARRTAQIGTDLKIGGPVAFFSWPSCATVGGYMKDEATVEGSVPALHAFLEQFVDACGHEKVHVIAHSMGNRALIRALNSFGVQPKKRFGQIILAAPDIDSKLFAQLAGAYAQCAMRTTLYASRSDRALGLSAKAHGNPRAGYYEPYTVVTGVDSIAVPGFNIDLLGHNYFASAAPLLFDIFTLFQYNSPPKRRQRIKALVLPDKSLWELT